MYFALGIILAAQALALPDSDKHHANSYRPIYYSLGLDTPEDTDSFKPYGAESGLTLTTSSPVLTLDYGAEVAGFPYVVVQTTRGPTQVELKYSEPYDGLQLPYSDGPL